MFSVQGQLMSTLSTVIAKFAPALIKWTTKSSFFCINGATTSIPMSNLPHMHTCIADIAILCIKKLFYLISESHPLSMYQSCLLKSELQPPKIASFLLTHEHILIDRDYFE